MRDGGVSVASWWHDKYAERLRGGERRAASACWLMQQLDRDGTDKDQRVAARGVATGRGPGVMSRNWKARLAMVPWASGMGVWHARHDEKLTQQQSALHAWVCCAMVSAKAALQLVGLRQRSCRKWLLCCC